MEEKRLTSEQLDALKEIGTVGAGNAATAMSQFFTRRVTIDVTRVELLNLQEVSGAGFLKSGLKELNLIVHLKILGKLKGQMWILYPRQSALLMIATLTKKEIGSIDIFSREDESVISETSHILCCSYLNAIGEFLGLHYLIPSIAQIALDKIEHFLGEVLREKSTAQGENNYILPIENNLVIEGAEIKLLVIFLLEYDSVHKTLKLVGL